MKKVIFICLLTLSICLSAELKKAEEPTPAPHEGKPPAAPATHQEKPPASTDPPKTATVPTPPNNATNGTKEGEKAGNETKTDTTPKPANETVVTTTAAPTNGTDDKGNTTTTKAPATLPPKPAPIPDKAPTEKPTATTEKPILQARGFDGASFVGGIILTLGLLAIGFMGFKYYKAQTERNYHTL